MRPGGKILIVSFHSIEDKIVKYFFTNYAKNKSKPSRYLPEENEENIDYRYLFENYNKKIIKPSINEINKRLIAFGLKVLAIVEKIISKNEV